MSKLIHQWPGIEFIKMGNGWCANKKKWKQQQKDCEESGTSIIRLKQPLKLFPGKTLMRETRVGRRSISPPAILNQLLKIWSVVPHEQIFFWFWVLIIHFSPGTWSDQSLGGGWSCKAPSGWSRGQGGPWRTPGCPRSCPSCRRSRGKASPSWFRPAGRKRSLN